MPRLRWVPPTQASVDTCAVGRGGGDAVAAATAAAADPDVGVSAAASAERTPSRPQDRRSEQQETNEPTSNRSKRESIAPRCVFLQLRPRTAAFCSHP